MPHGTGAERPRAAVVGSGVAGLTAAYLLQRAYDVTLYEADDRLGGHAHSHDIATDDGRLVTLDSGFIVHNAHAYPGLLRLFGELGVGTRERHVYLLRPDSRGRATAGKDFYVSPFLPVTGRYRMRLPEPADSLRLAVTLDVAGRPMLAATVTGRRHAYTPGRLLGLALRHPWVTAQVSALIRWQGIRLLAEGYMAGDWDSPDLVGLFTVFAAHLPAVTRGPVRALRRWYVPRGPTGDEASLDGARRNIQRHYDLSNEMFALFLDPTMTYSSALFAPGDTLAGAQRRKNETLLDLTGVGPGTTVLEIGTGWGELAIRAAARGAQVTTLTISPAQAAKAWERAAAAGLADRVDVRTLDYREARGRYDVVLSVEMIEAVGQRNWPGYFAAIDRLLAPAGRAGLQAITMPHEAMIATRHGHTWIQKYIFPGGQIPSLQAIGDTLRAHTALRISSDLAMGAHYARTLQEWRARFTAADGAVARLGFSPSFRRMWNLYLAYAEAGFRARYLDVHQLILHRSS